MAGASAEPASRPLQGLTRQPRRRGEQARLSYRLDPPQKRAHSRDTHTPPRWGPEEDTGVKGNDTTARPQAPERRPGALQGHHRGSNEARSRTRAGGAQRSSGTALPTAGRAARGAHAGKAKREHLLCQKTHGPHRRPPRRGTGDRRSGPEAATQPPPSSPSPTARGEKSGEGPRGQTEKSRHVPREHLSLVWHGLGPARESTTTPHRSDEPRWSRGEGTARTVTRGARFKPHRQPPPPTSPQARAAHDPRRFENA